MDSFERANIEERVRLLSAEILANEEENRFMEAEINTLYAKLDADEDTK